MNATPTITLEILEGPNYRRDDDGWEHHAYKVRLKRGTPGTDYTELDTPWMQGVGITEDPTPEDVLASLLMDASSIDNARGFEDWAEASGYDADSRKAERLYNRVAAAALAVKSFLGSDYDDCATEDAEDAAKRLVNA